LHLDARRPQIIDLFFRFLDEQAGVARALYILGDLFEFWIGDDDNQPHNQDILNRLQAFAASGSQLYFMHGNRDFLVGDDFSRQSHCKLLNDPSVIDLFGNNVLLMHGDTLCTDDADYQAFRKEVRSNHWQEKVMAMAITERIEYFRKLREASSESINEKPAEIMDVSQDTVMRTMNQYRVQTLIHGHTHRPGVHDFQLNNQPARRIVLGDWYVHGSVLVCNEKGMQLETHSLTGECRVQPLT
jgi:UDP-2,3-diacylglucosamine hydrolase